MALKSDLIPTLPVQFTGQAAFLASDGDEFITEFFDTLGWRDDSLSADEMGLLLSERWGRPTTRGLKVRAALAYLIAEGGITGEPQVFRVAGKYRFTAPA